QQNERTVFTLNAVDPVPAVPVANAYVKSQTEVALSWNAPLFSNEFQVQRSTTSGSGFVDIGPAQPYTTTTYVDNTGLSIGTTYYYRVKVRSVGGSFSVVGQHAVSAEVQVVLALPMFDAISIPLSTYQTQGV